MEETDTNAHIEVYEWQHHHFTPNQSVIKDTKNIAVTSEEITKNPEYEKKFNRRAEQTITNEVIAENLESGSRFQNRAVQTNTIKEIEEDPVQMVLKTNRYEQIITNEKIIIPKQNLAINQNYNLTIVNSEVASSEEPNYLDKKVSVLFHDNAFLEKEEAIRKREEAILQYAEKLKEREEAVALREKNVAQMEMEIRERQEILKIKEQQIVDRETEIKHKIRELEADG